jgi:hypothetical protein
MGKAKNVEQESNHSHSLPKMQGMTTTTNTTQGINKTKMSMIN